MVWAVSAPSKSAEVNRLNEEVIRLVLTHADPSTRCEALGALSELLGKGAREIVRAFAEQDPSPEVRARADGMLKSLDSQK